MSITWGERPGSRETASNPDSATLHYVLTGTNSEITARFLAMGNSPAMYDTLYRTGIALKDVGAMLWDVTVSYGPRQKKEPEAGDFSWSFDTTGGTKHITHALEHIQSYVPAGDTAADHKGAIGVTDDAVEGTDVIDHSFKWKENHNLLLANYGWAYSSYLDDMTGKANDATFRGKAAGTVLFAGATGGQSSKDPLLLALTFNFEYSRPVVNLTVGDITNINKGGHEYWWVEYKKADGGAAKRLATIPKQVNIERVLDEADFSTLGIGTAAP